MNPFTVTGPGPQRPAPAPSDPMGKAPGGDFFARLLSCLPRGGVKHAFESPPPEADGAETLPSAQEPPAEGLVAAVQGAGTFAAIGFSAAPARDPSVAQDEATGPAGPATSAGDGTDEDRRDTREQTLVLAGSPAIAATIAAAGRISAQMPASDPGSAGTPGQAAAPTAPPSAPIVRAGDQPQPPGPAAAPPAAEFGQALTVLPRPGVPGSAADPAPGAAAGGASDRQDGASASASAAGPERLEVPAPAAGGQAIAAPPRPADPSGPPLFASQAAADPTLARHLDLARDSQWLDRLASDIARTAGKDGALRFSLHPKSLGTLEVEVRHAAAGVSVRLSAETEAARAILADAQPRLAAEARAQGVRIGETHVDLAGHFSGEGNRGQHDPDPQPLLRTAAATEDEPRQEPVSRRPAPPERYA